MKNWLHDIYWAPTAKLGGGWICHKDSPSPPPAPDYTGAAVAQGAANTATAQQTARLSNPNVTTPYGQQTVSFGQPTFNQAGYDQAVAAAGNDPNAAARGSARNDIASLQAQINANKNPEGQYDPTFDSALAEAQGRLSSLGDGPAMPSRDQFTSSDPNQPTVTQTLAPAQQQLLESSNRISQNLANVGETGLNRVGQGFATPFDTSNIRTLQADPAARQAAQDAAYRQATSRLDPQFQTQQAQTETQLRNQGLVPGSEAYDAAMRNFNFGKNDAYSSAFNNSFNTGLAAQQADFGMQNQANQGNIQNQSFLRNLPLNELNALRTGSQVTNPQFGAYNPTQVAGTPIMGATQAQGTADQNIYNAQTGAANSFNSGLMSTAAMAAMYF